MIIGTFPKSVLPMFSDILMERNSNNHEKKTKLKMRKMLMFGLYYCLIICFYIIAGLCHCLIICFYIIAKSLVGSYCIGHTSNTVLSIFSLVAVSDNDTPMASSSITNPPRWDEKTKAFDLWLREVKVWKLATGHITSLTDMHGLQLALHLPEGSEIRTQVFDTLEPEEMTGNEGFGKVLALLEKHYAKDESSTAFQAWKDFKTLARSKEQSIDNYVMMYEQSKLKLKLYKKDLNERIHGLNLLCSANLDDDALRICM